MNVRRLALMSYWPTIKMREKEKNKSDEQGTKCEEME